MLLLVLMLLIFIFIFHECGLIKYFFFDNSIKIVYSIIIFYLIHLGLFLQCRVKTNR